MTDVLPTVHGSDVPYGALASSQCKEQLSIVYAHSVATAARCKLEHLRIDDETVDATVRQVADHKRYHSTSLDIQLKCSSSAAETDDEITWRLKDYNYDFLRDPFRMNPIILVIVMVPKEFESWVRFDEERFSVEARGYWVSLRDRAEISAATCTVKIPKKNKYDVASLLGMMKRIGDGGVP
ncbi:DUF4365 domain-containing protein [Nocardia tengchongensis]|uniref:DUF4365 domain-containing protein n=1 Tax=Nocardia tengchongensis TaxID=2055889 RepID=UPI00364A9C53